VSVTTTSTVVPPSTTGLSDPFVAAGRATLPATGADSGRLLAWVAALFVLGAGATFVGRRRTSSARAATGVRGSGRS
jgi:LPXTG-motif cell wall-anchored protein